jgi:hypothetical protein
MEEVEVEEMVEKVQQLQLHLLHHLLHQLLHPATGILGSYFLVPIASDQHNQIIRHCYIFGFFYLPPLLPHGGAAVQ